MRSIESVKIAPRLPAAAAATQLRGLRKYFDFGQVNLKQLNVGLAQQRIKVLRYLESGRVLVLVAKGSQ